MRPPPRHRPPTGFARTRREWWLAAAALLVAAAFTAAIPNSGESEPPAEPLDDVLDGESGDTATDRQIVPEGSSAIRFSHDTHADVACQSCHDSSDPGADGDDADLMPEMTDCASCHADRTSDLTPEPHLTECSGCHVGYDQTADTPIRKPEDWRAVEPPPMIPPRPDARVSFDHDQHVDALRDDDQTSPADEVCSDCHTMGADGPSMPTRATCNNCHTDQPGRLKPSNHTVGWERRHGSVARANPSQCEDCHTEDDCAGCHSDDSAEPFSVHPPNFDTLHAVDARAQSDDCAECHTVETFCRQCHARTNRSPTAPDRPPPRFDMHPPNWTEPGAPRNHAVMARRNITDCASCHTENDCVQCHQGVNPHPPEFQLKCQQWLEANPTPCAKCHGNLGRLRSRCL